MSLFSTPFSVCWARSYCRLPIRLVYLQTLNMDQLPRKSMILYRGKKTTMLFRSAHVDSVTQKYMKKYNARMRKQLPTYFKRTKN